jgi:hypothetical protein
MTIHVVLKAGDVQSGRIDLSWEGEAELELSVGPFMRGRFLNMDVGILNGIAHRTDVTLHIEGRGYELTSEERSGAFEALAVGLSGSGP